MLLVGVVGVNAQQIKGKCVNTETKAPFESVNVGLYSEREDKIGRAHV